MNKTTNNKLKLRNSNGSHIENGESDKNGDEKEPLAEVLENQPNVDLNDESSFVEQCQNTEYIPSEVGNSVPISGVNTVSNGPSGQPSSCSSKNTQELMDSKKYKESHALYELSKRKTNECESSFPKRRKTNSESALTDQRETTTEPRQDEKGSDNHKKEDVGKKPSLNCDKVHDSTTCQVNASTDYLPSEYGSFQKSGCISTFTESNVSITENIESKSTNTSNSKGGIAHKETTEK